MRASKTLYDTLDRTITLGGDATLDFGLLVTTPTITIGSNGAVSPSPIFIAVGQRVTFVNAHSFGHSMASDPHPFRQTARNWAVSGSFHQASRGRPPFSTALSPAGTMTTTIRGILD